MLATPLQYRSALKSWLAGSPLRNESLRTCSASRFAPVEPVVDELAALAVVAVDAAVAAPVVADAATLGDAEPTAFVAVGAALDIVAVAASSLPPQAASNEPAAGA